MTISAPSSVSCENPPEFTLEGAGGALFSSERSAVNSIVSRMAKGLAQSCPDVDTLMVSGEDRGIRFSFEVQRDNEWMLDAPSEPAKEPAKEEEVSQDQVAAKNPAPTPPPPEPPKPEIKPGIPIEQFMQIFGPVATVRGYLPLDNRELWPRVLAARAFAERPELLQDDVIALELVEQLLTPVEMQQLKGPLAGKPMNQWSVFERRDLANRIRTQLAPGLEGRRQTGPINVYHSVPIQLGEYDFSTSSFPLDSERVRQHPSPRWKNVQITSAFDSIVLPTSLAASVEQARQLDNYLRQRNDNRLYLAVFAEIDPGVPASVTHHSNQGKMNGRPKVKQIALFADQGLTQILFDYTPVLADLQAEADLAFNYLQSPISGGEDFVRAIGTLNDSDAAAVAMALAYERSGQHPPKPAAQVLAEFGEVKGPTRLKFGGNASFGTYDPVRKVLPIQNYYPQHAQFQTMDLGFSAEAGFFPQVTEIPVSQEQANAIQQAAAQYHQLELRLEADMTSGSHMPQSVDYLQLNTTFRPHRIVVFSGRRGEPSAKRLVLADIVLPETSGAVPSLIESLRIDQ